jgi:predicted phage tail protein
MNEHRTMKREAYIPPPGGAMGGGGKGGSKGGKETRDNLRSRQMARIIDLIGEGPNVGIVGWTKGIFYDGVPLQNKDGTFNFTNAVIQEVLGLPDQPVMAGFPAVETLYSGPGDILHAVPAEVHVPNTDADRVRLVMSVPMLQKIDKEGNITGTSVSFKISIQNNGGGYQDRGNFVISGKTSSSYQREIILTLPAPGPWDVRVTRNTADSTSSKLMNDMSWDGGTIIVDAKVNYTLSHCVGTIIDAEQFGSIPNRTYLVDGRIINIPSNYDPVARTYTGVWDGTFKTGWTNNPAWCLYDMATHNRYGLGKFFAAAAYNGSGKLTGTPDIDKWALYEIAQWCDEPVTNGKGGFEPRFVCNAVLANQMAAFDLLNGLTSVFRGFLYWGAGKLIPVADKPRLPAPAAAANPNVVGIFSPSNVIDGVFNYQGSDLRSRHNQVTARWLDGNALGEERFSVAEDQASISQYGIMTSNVDVLGATTESQAQRSAKWMIYTDNYEGEVVDFAVGLNGAWVVPGDIIGIADPTIGGERRGGRVYGGTNSKVELDSTVTIAAGQTGYLTCIIGEGKVETMRVVNVATANGRSTLTTFAAFSAAPKPGVPWVLTTADLMITTWRVIAIVENDEGSYSVNAIAHNPGKWNYIENNMVLTTPDTSNIKLVPNAVTSLKVDESLVQINVNTVGVVALVSFTSSDAAYWDIDAKEEEGNWQRHRSLQTAFELEVTEGKWEFRVTPYSLLGRAGEPTTLITDIVGRYAVPLKVENFRVVVQGGVALFRWTPSEELDVKIGGHYELRFSPRTDGSARWDNATVVVDQVPGSASSTESFYQSGTWLLKTFDLLGLASPDEAMVVTLQTDESYQRWIRICEQPTWAGAKTDVIAENHSGEMWLVLAAGKTSGTYNFATRVDMGGVFSTRLSLDMLSVPYFPLDPTIDKRAGLVDTWLDWDSSTVDLGGTVKIEMRSTMNDPTLGTAVWTAWRPFTAGDQNGWGFEFRALLAAPAGENVAVQELCVLADVSNKIDENRGAQSGGITYNGVKLPVPFNIKFQSTPAVTVTMQNAAVGDYVLLSNKTPFGFDIEIKNGTTQVTGRKFDWHAMGY